MKKKTSALNALFQLALALGVFSVPNAGLCQTPIACGQTITNKLSSAGQVDQYNYAGTAGQVLSFAFWGPIDCYYGYQLVADIYNPGGQLVTTLGGCTPQFAKLTLT